MPCKHGHHIHAPWATTGTLVIERCEVFCEFCPAEKKDVKWKHAWHLRRHVESVHAKSSEYPELTVSEGWTNKKDGNIKRSEKKNALRRENRKRPAPLTLSSSNFVRDDSKPAEAPQPAEESVGPGPVPVPVPEFVPLDLSPVLENPFSSDLNQLCGAPFEIDLFDQFPPGFEIPGLSPVLVSPVLVFSPVAAPVTLDGASMLRELLDGAVAGVRGIEAFGDEEIGMVLYEFARDFCEASGIDA